MKRGIHYKYAMATRNLKINVKLGNQCKHNIAETRNSTKAMKHGNPFDNTPEMQNSMKEKETRISANFLKGSS